MNTVYNLTKWRMMQVLKLHSIVSSNVKNNPIDCIPQTAYTKSLIEG